ncbi:hypothetical protein BB560_006428 [Smittium megazygosporum]|uniref:Uncharacterized protein n=1 Tax=Smittium megazygosporum TaxID=133381 RepID=A0A2T9Y650_9FUNG|nr:hypothetical protein BB560_006428 [Smittium megazygosporum]
MNYKKLSYTYNKQVETLSTALKQVEISNTSLQADETPQERIYAAECELAPQSDTSIKTRHPIPVGGYFKSLEFNKTIKPNQKASKEDNYANKTKNSRRAAVATATGYDKYFAISTSPLVRFGRYPVPIPFRNT